MTFIRDCSKQKNPSFKRICRRLRHFGFNLAPKGEFWLFFGVERYLPHALRRACHSADFVGLDVFLVDNRFVRRRGYRHH